MSQELGSGWMSAYAAHFEPKVTLFNPAAAGVVQVLEANPRRWFVQFVSSDGSGTIPLVVPGPAPAGLPAFQLRVSELTYKFRDAPQFTVGEFYANWFAGATMLILEQLVAGE